MAKHMSWSRPELLVVFRLYCHTQFGRLHQRNPEIIEIARLLGRTPSAVAMKACNFASLDPMQRARQITALGNVSRGDRALWEEFENNPESIAIQAEGEWDRLFNEDDSDARSSMPTPPTGPTEIPRTVRIRRVQGFFRASVLTSYRSRCALSDIALPELLNASHIIPWNVDVTRRADPRNGIALNTLYDRAFDRGLITFDESCRVLVSRRLVIEKPPPFQKDALIDLEGAALRLPDRFAPDPTALAYHREHIFDR